MGKPKIRFKGYTEDWEQRKLGEIITEYKETVDSECTLPILTSSKTEGVILQEEHFGRKQQHDITGYNILPRNYCTYRNRSDGVDFTFNINKCCDKGIISKFYPVFSGKNSDVLFLSLVLNNSDEVVREIAYTCTGTGQKVLSFLDLQKMKVRVPSYDEQKEIAAYFENLDHLITLHQRKYDETKKLKKCMLQKMFPKEGEKVPEIRFSGFTGDWKQRKLGEIVNRITRKNSKLISELPLTISAQQGLIDQNEFFDKRVASKDVSGYYLIKNGEFAYNRSTSNDAPWGAIKRLDRYENGVLSTLYIVFEIKDETLVNSDFLVAYYNTNLWHKGIHEIAAEGARNHGLLNIAPTDFFKTKLKLPADIEEQQEIGEYFKKIDSLITFHHRKSNLFNKTCRNAWEQRKLGDVAEYRNGKAHENEIDDDGEYIVVNSKFVSTNGEIKKFSNAQNEPLYENEIAFVLSDVPNGRAIARTFLIEKSGKYTLNQRIAGITPHEDTDPYYLHIKMNRNAYFLKFDDGNKQTNLSIKDVLNYEDMYPNYKEQQKIGNYFRSLDHLITLHQQKCKQLQIIRKFMLQNIFL